MEILRRVIAEVAGCVNASGSDVRGFCADPVNAMKLELHRLNAKSLKFAYSTDFADGMLCINEAELLTLIAEDPRLEKNIDADIAILRTPNRC